MSMSTLLQGTRLYLAVLAKNGNVVGLLNSPSRSNGTQYFLFKYFRVLYYIQNSGQKVYVEQNKLSKR